MKITVYECDKCHKRFDKEEDVKPVFGYDLCNGCYENANKNFNNWLEEKVEKPMDIIKKKLKETKVEPEEQEKKIDWNKACALKEAGWKNKDIADELSIDAKTLNSGTFYKKLEAYRNGERFS